MVNFSFVSGCDHQRRQGTTSLFSRYYVIFNQINVFGSSGENTVNVLNFGIVRMM